MSNDQTLTIGKIFTQVLQDHESDLPDDFGQFELTVTVGQRHFMESGDKLGLVKSQIAHHLASAITDTKVPVEYWRCEIAHEMQKGFNLPATFSFAVT